MILQLTKSQLQALEQELSECINYEHIDLYDKLLVSILHSFYKRVVIRLLDLKSKYNVKMDTETALAFYLYFNDEKLSTTSFNDVTIKTICNTINREYA